MLEITEITKMKIINRETNEVITEWDYPTVEIDGNIYNKKIKDTDGSEILVNEITREEAHLEQRRK